MSEESSDVPESALELEEDFRYLIQLLPEGWQEKARSLGALGRCRGVSDAESLLRVLLIHLAEGLLVARNLFAGSARQYCATERRGHHGSLEALREMVSMDEHPVDEQLSPTSAAERLWPAIKGQIGGRYSGPGAWTDRFELGAPLLRSVKFLSL
jgi:hypothetical protein